MKQILQRASKCFLIILPSSSAWVQTGKIKDKVAVSGIRVSMSGDSINAIWR